MWCDDVARSGSRKRNASDSDSDDGDIVSNTKRKTWDREDCVQEVVEALKEEHGDRFTIMQYRSWSEMVAGGMHGSTSEPPATSMFLRAGGANSKKPAAASNVSESVSRAMTQIASALVDTHPQYLRK